MSQAESGRTAVEDPLRICFFADAAAEHTRRWAKYFALKGHQVDLITWRAEILDDYEPVRVHSFRKPMDIPGNNLARLRNLPTMLSGIRKLMRELRPHVIHAHSVGAYSWLPMLSAYRPFVATPWGSDILLHVNEHWVERIFTRAALRRADLVTCDAYFVKDEVVKFGVDPAKVEVIAFGVDLERFHPGEAGSELRTPLGWDDATVVLSNRTLNPIHDVESFIRAIPRVSASRPEARFVILGGGEEASRLERLTGDLGVRDLVFFGGHVTEDEMAAWLRASDVYVSTSLSDAGLAAGTAEAMACELPVVSTDNSENHLWIDEGEGGYLVPNRDPERVADATIRLLEDGDLRRRFGKHNRRVIELRNSYESEMSKMEDLYRSLSRVNSTR